MDPGYPGEFSQLLATATGGILGHADTSQGYCAPPRPFSTTVEQGLGSYPTKVEDPQTQDRRNHYWHDFVAGADVRPDQAVHDILCVCCNQSVREE